MSTRPDPWESGAVEMATRNGIIQGSVGLAQARPLTKPPAMRKQLPAGLGAVTVRPTYRTAHSGVGLRRLLIALLSLTYRTRSCDVRSSWATA